MAPELRRTAALRRLVGETRLHPVASMPGVQQRTIESLRKAASEAVEAGVGGLILFGILSQRRPRVTGGRR